MTAIPIQSSSSIDRRQLVALLRCYWRLGTRGKMATAMGRSRSGKPRGLMWIGFMYAVLGLITGEMALAHVDVFTFTLFIHSMTFFIVGMATTSESGDILFSTNEVDVLGHRPIHPRTLLLAKSLNLMGLNLFLAGSLNLFPTFFGMAARGATHWFPLIHIASTILMCVFCSAAVICTYGLIVRLFDREKFDNFATLMQIAMSILFFGGYQFVPRILPHLATMNPQTFAAYLLPLPPAWCAAIDSLPARSSPIFLLLAVTGVLVTAALSYSAIGKLAPSYGEALTRLSETRARAAKPAAARSPAKSNRAAIDWLVRDPIERAAFRLAAAYMWRDRQTKLRLYPSIAMFVLLPLINVFDQHRQPAAFFQIFTVWMISALPIMALETLRTSAQPAAAEIFAAAPLSSYAPIFFGVRAAILFYLLTPIAVALMAIIALFAQHAGQHVILALPGLIAIPALSLLPGLLTEYLPLSQEPRVGSQSSRNMAVMMCMTLTMAILAALATLAWNHGFFPILLGGEVVVLFCAQRFMVAQIRRRPPRPSDGN